MIANPTIERIVDLPCLLGENPLWLAAESALYWTDIPAARIYRWRAESGGVETVYQGEMVGGFTFQVDDSLLLFSTGGTILNLVDGQLHTVVESLPGAEELIFNDVIADPLGGVFCGTKYIDLAPGRTGDLYYLNPRGQIAHLMSDIQCSNGFAFTRDQRTLFYTDTWARKIYRFNYDNRTGAISGSGVFIDDYPEQENLDGMTVDSEGCIWSAIWGGSCLIRFSPEGQELARITFPAVRVTSLTFGGADYDEIFVTTAGGDDRGALGDGAGAVFRVRAGVRGVPEFRSRVRKQV